MRLGTIATERGPAAAVVDGEAFAVVADERGRSAYGDVGALLRDGSTGLERAERAREVGAFEPLDTARLLRPVTTPGAVVCVGLNYRTHVLEMGRPLPEHPTFFAKLARALTDPYADVELPLASRRVDYEGELALVIGAGGRNLSDGDAWDAIAGFTLLNDVTMRDFQTRTLQWFAGKTWQAATPVGPVVVTRDELEPLGEREIRVDVNGEARQRAPFGDLIFDAPALVADLSRIVALEPGDLITTGTPGGVGEAMEPKRYLVDGDVVEVSVDGLGSLRNRFRAVRC